MIDFHNRLFGEKVKSGIKSGRTLKRFEITKEKVLVFLKAHFDVSDKPLSEIKVTPAILNLRVIFLSVMLPDNKAIIMLRITIDE